MFRPVVVSPRSVSSQRRSRLGREDAVIHQHHQYQFHLLFPAASHQTTVGGLLFPSSPTLMETSDATAPASAAANGTPAEDDAEGAAMDTSSRTVPSEQSDSGQHQRPSSSSAPYAVLDKLFGKRLLQARRYIMSRKSWLKMVPTENCDILMTFPDGIDDQPCFGC
ncbi:hypothetical protein WMY93_000394 [Mugilogobius chulae]|uniref:Uncharacterized protein n=1 Tax=Mugilogobius chulae TaxID=88201 RepID=A0AAW0Q0T7_9GOBI